MRYGSARMHRSMSRVLVVPALILSTGSAEAASLDGAAMSLAWALPFAGLLMTIATGPTLFRKIWHAHYGKIALAWVALVLAPLALAYGAQASAEALAHALLGEYLGFIIVLFALYTVAGGILVTGNLRGSPATNTAILALGTALASIVGTTGVAMILIRPIITANQNRSHRVHVIVFFIILVANVGGALTPLGDPPLFVGFLRGVDFFWPAQHLWLQTAIIAGLLLAMFHALDTFLSLKEEPRGADAPVSLQIHGKINLALIALIIAVILLSAVWKPGTGITIFGTTIETQNLARNMVLIVIVIASLRLTPDEHRAANGFTWEPIAEVAKLFAAIFVALIPVQAMLQAGRAGPFAFLLAAVTANDGLPHEAAYFWLTGMLSAFLDNAPTYLVFFELAGGDAKALMGPLAGTLAAISMGAVYMGALTYIGNAPNLMVQAIAEERGIRMPSFFGYFFWASLALVPPFLLLTALPIPPILKLF
jgi:Na+/H+ antiporter NhaD/arsenite permease-like protein